MYSKHVSTQGQSLIEVIVSLAVVVMLATGLIAGTTASLKMSQYTRSRSEATKLAQEGMEVARSDREKGWINFQNFDDTSGSTFSCLGLGDLSFIGNSKCDAACTCTAFTVGTTRYTRMGEFEWLPAMSPPSVRVKIVVQWQEGSTMRTSFTESYFTQWR